MSMTQSTGRVIAAACAGGMTSAISGVATGTPPPSPPFRSPSGGLRESRAPRTRDRGSIRLDSGGLDESRVLHQLALDHGVEIGYRHGQGIGAELADLRADLRRLHQVGDLLVQPVDDLLRRLRRYQRADPEVVGRLHKE